MVTLGQEKKNGETLRQGVGGCVSEVESFLWAQVVEITDPYALVSAVGLLWH